jgi:DNA-binding XRE family transcriptional regulator
MNTTLQTIKNTSGNPEYVLLPVEVYEHLKENIDLTISKCVLQESYADFNPADFVKNRIALARMKAKVTQVSLAKCLNVSQAYISKIENDEYKVTNKLFEKTNSAIKKICSKKHSEASAIKTNPVA